MALSIYTALPVSKKSINFCISSDPTGSGGVHPQSPHQIPAVANIISYPDRSSASRVSTTGKIPFAVNAAFIPDSKPTYDHGSSGSDSYDPPSLSQINTFCAASKVIININNNIIFNLIIKP